VVPDPEPEEPQEPEAEDDEEVEAAWPNEPTVPIFDDPALGEWVLARDVLKVEVRRLPPDWRGTLKRVSRAETSFVFEGNNKLTEQELQFRGGPGLYLVCACQQVSGRVVWAKKRIILIEPPGQSSQPGAVWGQGAPQVPPMIQESSKGLIAIQGMDPALQSVWLSNQWAMTQVCTIYERTMGTMAQTLGRLIERPDNSANREALDMMHRQYLELREELDFQRRENNRLRAGNTNLLLERGQIEAEKTGAQTLLQQGMAAVKENLPRALDVVEKMVAQPAKPGASGGQGGGQGG
jgi:hypothetical protein